MEQNKSIIRWVIIVALAAVCVISGITIYDSIQSARADSENAYNTIQQLKDENRTIRTELERTRAELERGQAGIRQAEETTDGLRGRNEQSSAVISDSQRIIGEIGEEFRDIDEANGLSETQASGQEQAE